MTATTAPIPLGRLVMTRAVADLAERHPELRATMLGWLPRHARGECPHLSEHDQQANALAVEHGDRILTSWPTGITEAPKLWIITEWDRSATTYLLPDDY